MSTDSKIPPASDELSIFLSFHLVGDMTFEIQKKYITNLLHTNFGDTYSLEHEDPSEASERKVIFRIEKPLMKIQDSNREFFEKLDSIFEETKRYLPSFTQGLEIPQ